ncbi:hemerythrin family protein [Campylobacter sp. IFREMER_LSEM_CL908]|uniref:hemerythrin family protein n=1 Tax=Campylobacter sp. IFREMER_LSEM_CL908 TaxID=2911624 RepID=UPI0021E913FC|nr:hemerythrin family protein [Campylobacter sp. IFREMER_LSEM_CL908]MCV3393926.1 hemerythrin family protein [Campylobacter sp. IFREMER_LSEM_CL908]
MKNNHVSINEVRMLSIEFLKQLKDHAKYEEKYMKRIAYPYIDIHIKEHKKIMSSLASLVKNTSNINEFKTKFSDFIDDNIIKHILEEDIKYANFKKKEYVLYTCGCLNKKYKISHNMHLKIFNGAKYDRKICQQNIRLI